MCSCISMYVCLYVCLYMCVFYVYLSYNYMYQNVCTLHSHAYTASDLYRTPFSTIIKNTINFSL